MHDAEPTKIEFMTGVSANNQKFRNAGIITFSSQKFQAFSAKQKFRLQPAFPLNTMSMVYCAPKVLS